MTSRATDAPHDRGDPSARSRATGRLVVPLTAVVTLSAVLAYGVQQHRQRAASEAMFPEPTIASSTPRPPLPEILETEVVRASERLDVARLAELEAALLQAEKLTTLRPRATLARLARGEAQATRALEAAMRSGATGKEPPAAIAALAQEALATLEPLGPRGPHAARAFAARSRAQLAAGQDVLATEPRILLPGYRDSELRWVALGRPLWNPSEPLDDEALHALETELAAASSTAMTGLLLALAARRRGDLEATRARLEGVLRTTPMQPTALALLASLGVDAATPATEAARPSTPPQPSGSPTPPPAGSPPPPPAARPSTPLTASGASSPPPPAAVDPPAATTTGPSSEPHARRKTSGPPPDPATSWTEEGCRLVRGGDADRGVVLLRRAFDAKPGSAAITLCLAEGYRRQGKDASARALVDRVLRAAPEEVAARALAAELEADRGNVPAAVRHYTQLLAHEPEHAGAREYLARHRKRPTP